MEKYKIGQINSDVKESLLKKCKDTIETMEIKLSNERSAREDLEKKKLDLDKENTTLKQNYSDLSSKFSLAQSQNLEKIEEVASMQKKISDANQYTQHLEQTLEKQQEKAEKSQNEVEKHLKFIQELQNDLKSKQETLIKWTKAVQSIEENLSALTKENKELKLDLNKYLKRCEDLAQENQDKSSALKGMQSQVINILNKSSSLFEFDVDLNLNSNLNDMILKLDQGVTKFLKINKEKKAFCDKLRSSEDLKTTYENKLNEICDINIKLQSDITLYQSQVSKYSENNKKLKLDIENFAKKTQDFHCKILKKKQKSNELKKKLENMRLELERLNKVEYNEPDMNKNCKNLKQLLKNKEVELLEKKSLISEITNQLELIEKSSIDKFKSLEADIETLKNYYTLEIHKKDQEILSISLNSSKPSTKEQDLEHQIEFLKEECKKVKSHYTKIISYKETVSS
jgi:DNA repair exonuclease SbcCD ATPase subunit